MLKQSQAREFTGGHMIAIMLAFFGVIVGVNLLMASFATQSWTGLVVKNSYVASQTFNESAEAFRRQEELGWRDYFSLDGGAISYRITDRDGEGISAQAVNLTFRRPAFEAEDHTIVVQAAADGTFAADHQLGDGLWVVEAAVPVSPELQWRKSFRIFIKEGRLVQ